MSCKPSDPRIFRLVKLNAERNTFRVGAIGASQVQRTSVTAPVVEFDQTINLVSERDGRKTLTKMLWNKFSP